MSRFERQLSCRSDFDVASQVLKPFLDSGQLDMAIFDAVNDTTIRLSRSGVLLGPGTCVNPICVVANYLFDTLCHDIFQVRGINLSACVFPCSIRPTGAFWWIGEIGWLVNRNRCRNGCLNLKLALDLFVAWMVCFCLFHRIR